MVSLFGKKEFLYYEEENTNGEISMDYSIHATKEAGLKNRLMLNMYFYSGLMIFQKVLKYQKEEQTHREQDR